MTFFVRIYRKWFQMLWLLWIFQQKQLPVIELLMMMDFSLSLKLYLYGWSPDTVLTYEVPLEIWQWAYFRFRFLSNCFYLANDGISLTVVIFVVKRVALQAGNFFRYFFTFHIVQCFNIRHVTQTWIVVI